MWKLQFDQSEWERGGFARVFALLSLLNVSNKRSKDEVTKKKKMLKINCIKKDSPNWGSAKIYPPKHTIDTNTQERKKSANKKQQHQRRNKQAHTTPTETRKGKKIKKWWGINTAAVMVDANPLHTAWFYCCSMLDYWCTPRRSKVSKF